MKSQKNNLILILFIIIPFVSQCQPEIPNKEIQIASAVFPLPEKDRDGATVMGYNSENKLVVIRQGSNNFICIADNPEQDGLNIACYPKELDPFMARGRELRANGKNMQEIMKIRGQEVKDGKLKMPDKATLHILSGADAYYDQEKGEVVNGSIRYVIYIPYATSESTGLPLSPAVPGGPWIMDAGTHRAHIMITPPPSN
ncbi:MAG: hypothetical protein OEY34_06865 [Cyclobacteriaceae bacterium]|nr:hypothetical protein [Cyclobacteriaceae bacterium]